MEDFVLPGKGIRKRHSLFNVGTKGSDSFFI